MKQSVLTHTDILIDSVVNQKLLVEWASLLLLVKIIYGHQRAQTLLAEYENFHHTVGEYPPKFGLTI